RSCMDFDAIPGRTQLFRQGQRILWAALRTFDNQIPTMLDGLPVDSLRDSLHVLTSLRRNVALIRLQLAEVEEGFPYSLGVRCDETTSLVEVGFYLVHQRMAASAFLANQHHGHRLAGCFGSEYLQFAILLSDRADGLVTKLGI